MEDLRAILKELQRIANEEGLNPSSDILLDCAVRIFNAQHIQSHKQEERHERPADEPASEKQIYTLRKLKIPFSSDITKHEAHGLISERMGK